jgi:hypothetical protein
MAVVFPLAMLTVHGLTAETLNMLESATALRRHKYVLLQSSRVDRHEPVDVAHL